MSINAGFNLGNYGYNVIPRSISKEEQKLLSTYEVDHIMGVHGEMCGSEKGLRLAQYMSAMTEKLSKVDVDEQIRHAFMAMDFQCHGFLTVEDLRKAFSQVAPHIPAYSIDSTFRELDRDGDGRVSYKDFDFMMKYDVGSHI